MEQAVIAVTWNVGMFLLKRLGYVVIEPAPYKEIRLRYLVRALKKCKANIIALQELYDPQDIAYVVDKLRERFPYYAVANPEYSKRRMSPGLLILSEWPISDSTFHPFHAVPLDESLFVCKGMLEATIKHEKMGTFKIVNVHNTSGGMIWHPHNPVMHWYRRRQYREMFALCEHNRDVQWIFMGDFNSGPETSRESYKELLRYGDDAWTLAGKAPQPSWDPKNPLNAHGPHNTQCAETLDGFILPKTGVRNMRIVSVEIVFDGPVVRGPNEIRVTISDHYGVKVVFLWET